VRLAMTSRPRRRGHHRRQPRLPPSAGGRPVRGGRPWIDRRLAGASGAPRGRRADHRGADHRAGARGSGKRRTRLARLAWELGADWVFHNDQDEFRWPLAGDLTQTLAEIPERFGLVLTPRTEFVGRPGELLRRQADHSRGPVQAPAEDGPPSPPQGDDLPPTPRTSGSITARHRGGGWSGGQFAGPRPGTPRRPSLSCSWLPSFRLPSITFRFAPSTNTGTWSSWRWPTISSGRATGCGAPSRPAVSRRSTRS